MYIIELLIKWINKNKRMEKANPDNILKEGVIFDTEGVISTKLPEDDALTCEHNFMPVDSTGLVLACTKCGFVIKHR